MRYKRIATPLLNVDIHTSGANQNHTVFQSFDLWFTVVSAWALALNNIIDVALACMKENHGRDVCCCFAPIMHF